MRHRDSRILKLIALFRWFKAILLIGAGCAALRLIDPANGARLEHWLAALPLSYERGFANKAIAFVARLNPERAELLAAGAFAYAALFIVEGFGLWLERRWAEYLTIVATASGLPFEVYEVAKKVTALRVIVLLMNLAILIYLVWRVRHNE